MRQNFGINGHQLDQVLPIEAFKVPKLFLIHFKQGIICFPGTIKHSLCLSRRTLNGILEDVWRLKIVFRSLYLEKHASIRTYYPLLHKINGLTKRSSLGLCDKLQ